MPDLRRFFTRLISAVQQQWRAAGGRYRVTPLQPLYVGEDVPGNDIFDGSYVTYLSEAGRQLHALTFFSGRICDAYGNLFDTTDAESLHTGFGRAIFVMDADGNFYASKEQTYGKFHHSSLVAGGPVAAAGEIEVIGGVLTALSDRSGHYMPRQSFTDQAIDQLKKKNISFQGVKLDLIGRP